MAVFTQILNPVTGDVAWEPQSEDYEYHQEVARSAYADMLHDHERNVMYCDALTKAIAKKHAVGHEAHVLDIGTGTGLLAMIAARAGADSVVACEAFRPMADCCSKILKQNGFDERIRLIPKRSTQLQVGPGKDLKRRANILVTEVFDTELIGEGAIEVFSHAHEVLLEVDCTVVPSRATMYAVPVESALVRSWNTLLPIQLTVADGEEDLQPVILKAPKEVSRCPGTIGVNDLHLAQLPKHRFTELAEPVIVFEFDFSRRGKLQKKRRSVVGPLKVSTSAVQSNGSMEGSGDHSLREPRVDGVFMWWDLKMDVEGEIVLSCAPVPEEPNWRDHWMQAVYPVKPSNVRVKDQFWLAANHDEYSLWFDISSEEPPKQDAVSPMPGCHCGAHVAIGRRRLGELNDPKRIGALLEVVKRGVKRGQSVVAVLGDSPLLPISACLLGAKKVFCLGDQRELGVVKDYAEANDVLVPEQLVLVDIKNLNKTLFGGEKIDLILAEPFYTTAYLPWHNVRFWYDVQKLRHLGVVAPGATILPATAKIHAMGVEYKDLWKIRAPLGKVLGFDVHHFDELVEDAMQRSDPPVEPQPLWEYPCKALTLPVEVGSLDFSTNIPGEVVTSTGMQAFQTTGVCNGVALWMTWTYPGSENPIVLSDGPVETPNAGATVRWYEHSNQGVHFFTRHRKITDPWSTYFEFQSEFCPKSAQFAFRFEVAD